MIDNKFHKKVSSFKLKEIARNVDGLSLHDPSQGEIVIENIAPIDSADSNSISFLDNIKYIDSFTKTKASACIINPKYIDKAPQSDIALLLSDNPYFSYSQIAHMFYPQEHSEFISNKASIADSAIIGENCYIDDNVYIGDNVVIGNNCKISFGCSITHSLIGNNVIIHPNVSIGQDGFGFAFANGIHNKVPQLGKVIISDDVEIGSNSCIDRGSTNDTFIGEGTKIDNLVQIAHNVRVGKCCIIVAQVGISGSANIGDYTIIAGQVGIAGHLSIGSNVQIAAKSGVTKNIPDNTKYAGYPAVPINQFHRQTIAVKKLLQKDKK